MGYLYQSCANPNKSIKQGGLFNLSKDQSQAINCKQISIEKYNSIYEAFLKIAGEFYNSETGEIELK